MTAKFLNDRLVTSRRFSPGSRASHGSPSRDSAEAEAAADQRQPAEELAHLLSTEDQETRTAVAARDLSETRKRRREVINMLADLTRMLSKDQAVLSERIRFFEEHKQKLAAIGDDFSLEEMRAVKRSVEEARLEMARHAQLGNWQGQTDEPNEKWMIPVSGWHATRLGIALTWPLMVMIAISVTILLIALYSLFAV